MSKNPRAAGIQQERAQQALETRNARIEQLLVAIANNLGINVAAVLDGQTFRQVIEDTESKPKTAKK